jgi:hypothetical protein
MALVIPDVLDESCVTRQTLERLAACGWALAQS